MTLKRLLDSIPRADNVRDGLANGREAMIYIDHRGDLCILIDEVGLLSLNEDNLDLLAVED